MKIKNKNSGYTILVALMIIGFLVVLTTGVLNLVLGELKDNRGAGNYLKAYAAAEGAQELALLQIKKNGYGFYDKIDFGDYNAKILRNDPNNKKEILISYDLNSKTKSYSGTLQPYEQAVIPLFYSDSGSTEIKTNNITLNILNSGDFTDSSNMAWNIVSLTGDGIGGTGTIGNSTKGKGRSGSGSFLDYTEINGSGKFLDTHNKNYLIVINLDSNKTLEFNLSSSKYFTKPISHILSSAKIGDYKQNLDTTLDNTAFLSILKYSLYSN